jgi:glycerol-3-phosphate O-acyltransferase
MPRAKRSIPKNAAIQLLNLSRAWQWTVRKILSLWVRVTIKPDDAAAAIAARPRVPCYVLERESGTDLAVLSMVCAMLRLPRPDKAHF